MRVNYYWQLKTSKSSIAQKVKKQLCLNKMGFTLIEIVITLAIMAIVILMIFSAQSAGIKNFVLGSNQFSVQSDLRLVTAEVTNKIRFSKVTYIANSLGAVSANSNYIYLENGIVKLKEGILTPKNLTDPNITVNSLHFSHNTSNKTIDIQLAGFKGNGDFSVDTSVNILNLSTASIGGDSNGSVLIFGPPNLAQSVEIDAEYIVQNNEMPISFEVGFALPLVGPNGTNFTWSCSDFDVTIDAAQSVIVNNRPAIGDADKTISFVATIKKEDTVTSEVVSINKTYTSVLLAWRPIELSSLGLDEGIVNDPYTYHVTATGGELSTYQYSILSGSLPIGLSLASNGIISGIPTSIGTYNFSINLVDGLSHSDTEVYVLNVKYGDIAFSTGNVLPNGVKKNAYSTQLVATGGDGHYTFTSTDLNISGMNLSTDGLLSGTLPNTATTYTFTVNVVDNSAHSSTRTFSLTAANN